MNAEKVKVGMVVSVKSLNGFARVLKLYPEGVLLENMTGLLWLYKELRPLTKREKGE